MTKFRGFALLAAFAGMLTAGTAVAALKDATVAMTAGNWKVLQDKDAMTDKTNCTGVYKEDCGIQLTADTMFITVSGGIESITLRFGDEPAKELRLPSNMEKSIRAVEITGTDFAALQNVARLRYQVGTLVSGVKNGEIDLAGFQPALDSIKNGCPIEAAPPPAAPAKADPTAGSLCNDVLIARMHQQGMKAKQIAAVCK